MGQSRHMEKLVEVRENRPRVASRVPLQPATRADALLALQRTAGNVSVARWLDTNSRRALQRNELTTKDLPTVEDGDLREAWGLLKQLDAKPANADEINRIAAIAHDKNIEFLGEGMLARIRATPNTRLVVWGGLTSKKGLDEAGGTRLIAQAGDDTMEDVGYAAAVNFPEFMKNVKVDRKQVQFVIRIDIKIPYYGYARKPSSVAYFLETLMHELALHGEKYADRIVRWRESKDPWTPTFERDEHQEHMYAGTPRYMLLLHRLYEAAAVRSVPPELLTALEQELNTSKEVYTKEEITAPKEPAAVSRREMLDWIAELKQWLSAPEPVQSPQVHSDLPMLEPLPHPPRKSRLQRVLDWLASCIRRREPD